jgi:mono/diheme cytochrome c family protein
VHNVLYVVTEHDTVYAFDADNYVPTPYWTNSFINPAAGVIPVPGADAQGNIVPEAGITATPVIDPVTATIYVEARTKETSGTTVSYVHRLHALDLSTGLERTNFNSPVVVTTTNYPGAGTPGYNDTDGAGHVLWNGLREHCRPGLLLAYGQVYLAYASPGDHPPYYGWVFAYDAHTLAQSGVFNVTPNAGYGGIWMTGNGPASDNNGYIYLNTGNGNYDTNNDYGDSYLKLSATNRLNLVDYFTPYNQASLNSGDVDVSSAGLLLLPDSVGSAAHPHLLLGGSKANTIYLLDRDQMGGFNSAADSQIVQSLPNAVGGMWSSPAYFNGSFYIIGNGDSLKAFSIAGAHMGTTPIAHGPTSYGYPGATPTISANGTNDAIVWAIESAAYSSSGPAVLHAYNATNVAQELYNSNQNLARDNPGAAVEFTLPTVANGKVYVGAEYSMAVFGNASFLPLPTLSPNGGEFTGSVTVTLADAVPGTSLYYTLDGSVPSTNSLRYNGPLTLTNSTAVHVIAVKPGYAESAVAVAGFLNSATVGTGTGLSGAYYANQIGTFTNPPTLTRVDATIDFNWNSVGPDSSVGQTNFSVRWTGSVQPVFSEPYTFYATSDDGVRVWLNGQLLINGWVDQPPTTYQATIALRAQQLYTLQVDYYQHQGGAVAQLTWSSPSTVQTIIPQTQLYPYTNPPPAVALLSPVTNASFTATASVTLNAAAAAQYNAIDNVAFFANGLPLGRVSDSPYIFTVTGLAAGGYTLTAVATDGGGLMSTSSPVNITVNAGSGQPYGISTRLPVTPFLNMPPTATGGLPALLSQSGVFADTTNLIPTSGLIPYGPIVPQWSDGAAASRWLALPFTGGLATPDQQIGFATNGEWSFPSGTVFVENLFLTTDERNTNIPMRRLETRLLVRDPNNAVYGVAYKWRLDNSDADRVDNSLVEDVLVTNLTGIQTQAWYYPSPGDCLQCHTPVANYVLGVKTRQLNGNFTYPSSGTTDNELRVLNRLGLLEPAIDEASIAGYAQLTSLTDQSGSLTNRVRSYIDANCAQCHRPGGTGPSFDARYDTPLSSQNIINGAVLDNLGFDHAHVVTPRDIWRSVLYQRANTTNNVVQMPPLARNVVDSNAMAVIAAFINGLPGTPALAPPSLVPSGGTYNGSVKITASPPDTNAVIYYTLDGSLPTTNSLVYSGPILLTNSATLSANAFETGFINSVAATGVFTILPPLFFTSPGTLSNGVFQVRLSFAPNQTYVLQGSTDLATWTSLVTNTPPSTPFYLADPGAARLDHRFYRILLVQ